MVSRPTPGFRERVHLLETSVERVRMVLRRGRDAGQEEPLVLVLDLRDPVARAISRRVCGAIHPEDMAALSPPGKIPTIIAAPPRPVALSLLAIELPGMVEDLVDEDPGEGYIVVVVSANNARAFVMPPPWRGMPDGPGGGRGNGHTRPKARRPPPRRPAKGRGNRRRGRPRARPG